MFTASRTEKHVGREQDLRQQLLNALQHGDVTTAEFVLRRLDGLWRLRRLLRGAA